MNTNEPTMHNIDDYNGNESKEKKQLINTIIVSLLAIGVVLAIVKSFSIIPAKDYVGTDKNPGILIQKGH